MNLNASTRTYQDELEKAKVSKIEQNGAVAYIMQDEDPGSPDDWDNFGHFAHWHRRDNMFGIDQNIGRQDLRWGEPSDFQDEAEKEGWLVLPVSMLDHSGITVWVGDRHHWCDPGGWDSGQVGFIYATQDEIRKEFGAINEDAMERADNLLRCEVKTWDLYYTGQVYGHIIFDKDGEETDSCWGYYGSVNEYEKEVRAIMDQTNETEVASVQL